MLAHLAAGQLDSVRDREEVAIHTALDVRGRSIGFLNIFFVVFAVFAVHFWDSSFHDFLAIQLL
jgi:hypothetical protein